MLSVKRLTMVLVVMAVLAGITLAASGATPARNVTTLNNTPNTTTIIEHDYVFKPEEHLFTGTVVTNDLTAKTVIVDGHHPLRRETVDRVVTQIQGQPVVRHEAAVPPAVKNEMEVFSVDPFCRIVLTNTTVAKLSDLKPGIAIDVSFRQMAGNAQQIASVIKSAARHPYDSTAPSKK